MKNATVFISLILLIACKNEPGKSKYFEGYVDYKVETVSLDTSQRVKQFVKLSGNSMRCYFKEGNYVWEYFDSNNISNIKFICQESTVRIVCIDRSLKNYYYSLMEEEKHNKQDWTVLDSNLTATLLNKRCNGFSCTYIIKEGRDFNATGSYYYAVDLPLHYSGVVNNNNDPYFNYWKSKFPYVALLIEEEIIGKIKTTSTATRIVSTPLPDTLFTIPADKPLIHFPG